MTIVADTNDPLARIRALQSPETRARLDLMERVKARYLHMQRDDNIAEVFDGLLNDLTLRADPKLPDGPGNRREGGAIVLVGESGAGKSLALKRLLSRHAAFPGYCVPRSGCGAIYVRVPSPCTLKALGRITLRQLGLPIKGNPPSHIVWEMVYERIEHLKIVVLHFDEMHNVTRSATEDEIDDIRNMIKTLVVSPTWPIVVLISGMPEIVGVTQPIDEIRRRCKYIEFDPLTPNDIGMIDHMVSGLAKLGNLPVKYTQYDATIPRLIHASLHQLGTSIELAQEAICTALKAGAEGLAREHFARAFVTRTGCLPTENPFVVTEWAKADCTKVLSRSSSADSETDSDVTDASEAKGKRNGRRGRR